MRFADIYACQLLEKGAKYVYLPHTYTRTHSRAHTLPHTHANFQLICLHSSFSLFCVFYFVRESKFVVVELSTRQKSWLCATPPPDYAFV